MRYGTSFAYALAASNDAALGYQYLRARYYDQATGRFISKDRFPGLVTKPASRNLYAYSQNSPPNYMDPSGLLCVGGFAGGTAAAGEIITGSTTTGGAGVGGCLSDTNGLSGGIFGQYGSYAGTPFGPADLAFPRGTGNVTIGGYAGVGAGAWVSNANRICDLAGPFETISLDAAIGPVKGSVQFSWANGTWVLSVAPPGAGLGLGAAASKLTTTTEILWSSDEAP